jgi:hypothetical protein
MGFAFSEYRKAAEMTRVYAAELNKAVDEAAKKGLKVTITVRERTLHGMTVPFVVVDIDLSL